MISDRIHTEPSFPEGRTPGLDSRRSALQRGRRYLGHGDWCSPGKPFTPQQIHQINPTHKLTWHFSYLDRR